MQCFGRDYHASVLKTLVSAGAYESRGNGGVQTTHDGIHLFAGDHAICKWLRGNCTYVLGCHRLVRDVLKKGTSREYQLSRKTMCLQLTKRFEDVRDKAGHPCHHLLQAMLAEMTDDESQDVGEEDEDMHSVLEESDEDMEQGSEEDTSEQDPSDNQP